MKKITMEVKKDGNVWSALDKKLDICVSGATKAEAIANLEQASGVIGKGNFIAEWGIPPD